jgi:hypothetical protein
VTVQKVVVSGRRKYAPIWDQLKTKGSCQVKCPTAEDVIGTVNGLKKEKSLDKKKDKGKILAIEYTVEKDKEDKPTGNTIVEFKLITDTSLRNFTP